MKRNRLFPAICLVAALLLSACSQDEPTENSTTLPEGEYPLQIGSVTLSAEVSEQPWTRMAESTDGMSSEFKAGDAIGVSLNGETATYTYDGTAWTSEAPLYWKDKQPATVTAWYPVEEEIDFTQQDVKGLTYLLKADGVEAGFDKPANLTFSHQLAKVRVKLTGDKANEVQTVTVRSYPTSTHSHGTLDSQDRSLTPQYVSMREATYDGVKYWEANLRPGTLQANNSFEVAKEGGTPVRVTLENIVSITAGQVHTITISVNSVVPDDATVITDNTGNITDNGEYVVRGSDRTTPINITEGSPTIYLDGATVAVSSGNAINITGGNPTIYVVGEDNTISSGNGAGIYVTEGSTVTIKGSSRDDELTVRGGNGNSGIGGYIDDTTPANSGNINISNITLSVYGSYATDRGNISPGIGCSAEATCGTITISSATVHAFGITFTNPGFSVPGIGTGFTWVNMRPKNLPDVIAFNSEIHAHRGNPGYTCDYIGWAASLDYPSATYANSTINLGAGSSIKSSTVYCYTGDTLDKTMVYDENGGGKEQ